MSIQAHIKRFTNDFMVGHGKSGARDAIERQRPQVRRKLSPADIHNIYATNQIVQNIIDIPAEDLTRAWFTLKMEDENLRKQIMDKLRDLKAREKFQDMRYYERLTGDGFISIGARHSHAFELNQPLNPETLKGIDYIHAFSGFKVSSWMINEDMFSSSYGQVEQFQVNRRSQLGNQIGGFKTDTIHQSRLIHDQTRRLEDEKQGQPLIEPLYDIIKVLDTSLWSVGQILYDFSFKIYKSKDIDDMDSTQKSELTSLLDFMFRTEALALIGTDEELKKESTNLSGIDKLLDYVWDYLAGAARMPKTVLKGQEAGAIAGAQYDVMNYYSRIAAQQENELRPKLEHLIRLIMWSEEAGGRIDPNKVKWDIEFNPLWEVDRETDAKIRKMNAETDQIYIANGVLSADQIEQKRFGHYGGSSEIQFSGDIKLSDEELIAMTDKMHVQRQKDGHVG